MDAKLLRSFLSVVGGRFGVLFIGILTTPILVRLLGSEGYGDYAFVTSALAVILTLTAKDGVTSGVRKFMVEDREQEDWKPNVFSFYFHLSALLTVLAAIILFMIGSSGIVELTFGEAFITYTYLVALLLISEQMFNLIRATLLGLGAEKYSESFTVVQKSTYATVAIVLVYFGWGVDGALIGRIIGAAFSAFCCFLILSKYINLRAVIRPKFKSLPKKDLISFNFSTLVLVFLTTSLYKVDILMLRPLAGSAQTGYYQGALVIAEFLWFIPHAAQVALLHSMSAEWDQGNLETISKTASQITRYTLQFTVLLIIGLTALAEPFVKLYYGADFTPAVLPLLILLPGTLGFALARPIQSTAHASGELRHLIIATGSAAVINFVLNLVLIPMYGMYGAAAATSIGYGSMIVFHTISARRVGFDPLMELRLVKTLATGLIAASVIFPLAWVLHPSLISLIIVPPIGLLVYVAVAVLFGAVSKQEVARGRQTIENRFL
ncbi:flippase [Natronosalvus vescus]|uniref:flippase n=1 Tax=Natronosalvus vescus TaxID=2953881 RepID=UPI00209061B4|nr:flippase [Natronosalvus vescus]